MASRCKTFAKSVISRLRKLFRKPRHEGRTARAPDENLIVVDGARISQTAEDAPPPSPNPTANEDDDQQNQPLLPPVCRRLGSEDISVVGDHPARGGPFAEVWDGYLDGDRVVIKSYRTYSTIDCTPTRMRLYKEALACSQSPHKNIVPFRAAYTTPEHPLALVYDFMEHRDLREYLRNNRSIGRVRLLADIAQGLFHMHDLGIVHGNIMTVNILVDSNRTARIAGLGSAFIPSQNHATWSAMDAELLFYGTAPELVRPKPPRSRVLTSKESDIYAFAVLAWEVFAEQVPFPDVHPLAAIYQLANGARPPRPDHPELSDQVWNLIQTCWHDDPSHRIPIKDVVAILEAELSRNPSG